MTDEPDRQPPGDAPASWRTLALGVAATVVVLVVAGFLAVTGADDGEDPPEGRPPVADGDAPADDRPPVADGGQPADGDRPADDDQPALADRVSPTETAPLPEMSLERFGGDGEVSTLDYRGTPLLLNFWASWCGPCVDEMPDLQEVAVSAGDRLAVLGVNTQDDPDKAARLVDDLGVSYDLASDPQAALFGEVRAFGMPTTLFVSADGEIRYRHTGPLDAEAILDLAAEHLGVDAR